MCTQWQNTENTLGSQNVHLMLSWESKKPQQQHEAAFWLAKHTANSLYKSYNTLLRALLGAKTHALCWLWSQNTLQCPLGAKTRFKMPSSVAKARLQCPFGAKTCTLEFSLRSQNACASDLSAEEMQNKVHMLNAGFGAKTHTIVPTGSQNTF